MKKPRERFYSDTRCHKCGRTIMDKEVDENGIGWFIQLRDVGRTERKWRCQFCDKNED